MSQLGIETMSLQPRDASQAGRERAEKVANQFEAVFVKTLVGALRSTSSIGGEGGGMFGSGPGAETYAGWFDQNVADQLAKSGGIGIASALLTDMERHGELQPDSEAAQQLQRAAAKEQLTAATARKGGFDVVL
ncbi:MAG: rod-binding protein [Planctomycetes bacterium]|nr:rod-binding protein [Planctomycetota bacterium]